jgi:nitrogen regulatory protein P-II 2
MSEPDPSESARTESQRSETHHAAPRSEGFYLVTVILKPFRLDAVLNALRPFHSVSITANEVRGYGRQKGHLELYRGSEYQISFIPKLRVEIVVSGSELEEVLRAVPIAARTGRIGDGKAFVQKLDGLHSEEPVEID